MPLVRTIRRRSGVLEDEKGLTLLEVIISSGIAFIAFGMVLFALIAANRVFREGEARNSLQTELQMAMDRIIKDIMRSGLGRFRVPELNWISVSNTNPDSLTILIPTKTTYIREDMPQPSAILKVEDPSGFSEGDTAYISDGLTGESFRITHISIPARTIQHNKDKLAKAYPAGSIVFSAGSINYSVSSEGLLMISDLGISRRFRYVTGLDITFTLDDGSEVPNPPSDLNRIQKVNLAITGTMHGRTMTIRGGAYPRNI